MHCMRQVAITIIDQNNPIFSNKRLKSEIEQFSDVHKNLRKKKKKSFEPGQPARTAQADLVRDFFKGIYLTHFSYSLAHVFY